MNVSVKDIKGLDIEAGQLCSYLQTNIKVIMDSVCNREVPSKCLYDEYVLLSSLLEPVNPIIPNYLIYDKFQLAKQLNGKVYGNHVEANVVDLSNDITLKVDNTYLLQSIKSRITGCISKLEAQKRYNKLWLDIVTLSAFGSEKAQNHFKQFIVLSILTGDYELDEEQAIISIDTSEYSNKMRETMVALYKELLNSSKFKIQQVSGYLKFPVSYLFNE